MRPQRALVIARTQAFDNLNTEVKLVLTTSNHSSSFILSSKLSFAIPALLMRIVGAPNLSITAERRLLMDSRSVTLSNIPAPLISDDLKRSQIVSAPDCDVAVPTTVYPASPSVSAIAAPIPRLAPVTRATLD